MARLVFKQFFIGLLIMGFNVVTLSAKDTIIVVGDYDYPPYSFIDDSGNVAGHDVDLMNALKDYMGVNVINYNFQHWDSALTAIKTRKADVIACIVYSEEREKYFDFTIPLHTEYYGLFCRKELVVDDISDLNGKRVIVLEGDFANEKFLIPMGLMENQVYARSLPDAIMKIEQGLGDFVVAPYPLGMEILKKNNCKQIEVKGPPVLPAVYCLAVAKGDTELLKELNGAIKRLIDEGGLKPIQKKWIKYKRSEEKYEKLFAYSLWALLIAIGVITLVMFLWYLVNQQLKIKTEQIREVESVYQNIFNSMAEAVIVFSLDGYVVDANPVALKLYELSYDDIINKHGKEIIAKQNHYIFDKYVGKENENDANVEESIEKKVGDSIVYLNMHATLVLYRGKKHHLVMLRDVTKEREAAFKLIKAQEESESANRTKSAFLSTMSHEIRTPLNAIIGFSKLLINTELDLKQTDYTKKIDLSGRLLLNLINDVLDMTKIEAGRLQLDLEEFQLRPVLDRIVGVQRIKAQNKNLDLELIIADGTPNYFKGDELRLFQILQNLISNAIKFTDRGGVSVLVRGGKVFENHNVSYQRIWFTIKDTGIGIPTELIDKLFVPFMQVDNTSTRRFGGSGLGLSISKHLVDLMGGEIFVESIVEKGSLFSFYIDLQKITTTEFNSKAKVLMKEDIDIKGLKILLVEDNQFNAQIFLELLNSYGADVFHVVTGEKAVEAINDNAFDVVLMDIELPGIDGFETTRLVYDVLGSNKIPVIALSAHDLKEEKEKALRVGMVAYLSKPVQIEDLVASIMTHTRRKVDEDVNNKITPSGLDNFGGDEAMFLRALVRFKKVYAEAPVAINKLKVENKVTELKTIAHNLKSGAGMIGFKELSNTAKILELSIKDTLKIDDVKVNNLVDELNRALGEIVG